MLNHLETFLNKNLISHTSDIQNQNKNKFPYLLATKEIAEVSNFIKKKMLKKKNNFCDNNRKSILKVIIC